MFAVIKLAKLADLENMSKTCKKSVSIRTRKSLLKFLGNRGVRRGMPLGICQDVSKLSTKQIDPTGKYVISTRVRRAGRTALRNPQRPGSGWLPLPHVSEISLKEGSIDFGVY